MKIIRTNKPTHPIALLLAGLLISGSSTAGYMFTALEPVSGGARSAAYGINNPGQVVGVTNFNAPCFGCGGYTRATIWKDATAPPKKHDSTLINARCF